MGRKSDRERDLEIQRAFNVLAQERVWFSSTHVSRILAAATGEKWTESRARRLLKKGATLGYFEATADRPTRWALARAPPAYSPEGLLAEAGGANHFFEMPSPNIALHLFLRPRGLPQPHLLDDNAHDASAFQWNDMDDAGRASVTPEERIVDGFLSIPRKSLLDHVKQGLIPSLLMLRMGKSDLAAYFQHNLMLARGAPPQRSLVERCVREALRCALQRKGAWDEARWWGLDDEGNEIEREPPEDEPWPMLNAPEAKVLENLEQLPLGEITRRYAHIPVLETDARAVLEAAVAGRL